MTSQTPRDSLSIPRTPVPGTEDEPYLCTPSFAQEALWFLDQLTLNSTSYKILIPLRFHGPLQIEALHASLNALVQRHEVLRTTFEVIEGHPMQVITPKLELPLPVIDLSLLPEQTREALMLQLARETHEMRFDLSTGPLIVTTLLRLAPDQHTLTISSHHILMDGWSTEILQEELNILYNAFVAGEEPALPDLPVQYADFAAWQRELLQGETLEELMAYWRKQLEDAPALLELPTDRPRPAVQSYRGARYVFDIPLKLVQTLRTYNHRAKATLFMTLLAAFNVLLLRYTGQEDMVVGTPVAGRTRVGLEKMIGFFSNTLVLRTDLSGDPTFHELLTRERQVCLDALSYQHMPFEQLVEILQPERSLSYNPLFQVTVGMLNFSTRDKKYLHLQSVPVSFHRTTSRFDLVCDFIETPANLRVHLDYNIDLFDASTIERITRHFLALLGSIAAYPNRRISQLPMLSEEERHTLLVEYNTTRHPYPQQQPLHSLLEEQTERTPDVVALVYEDEQITYGLLNERANQLARYLRWAGIGPEVRVGLVLERSVEMVISMLAVLKVGGAYVPLDPDYPAERLAFIMHDAGIAAVLTQQTLAEYIPFSDSEIIYLDDAWSQIAQEETANLPDMVQPGNLAYVLYTSGSTGTPKGVQICHQALVNFLNSMQRQPGLQSNDVLLAVTSLSFDIAGLEIFLPLLTGVRLEIASRPLAMDGVHLAERIERSGVTVLQATPATWRVLIMTGWIGNEHLKILCGGEALPRDLAQELLMRGATVWNLYGPTETTIWSTLLAVQEHMPGSSAVPIGSPIDNTEVYVLDEHLHLAPLGTTGELYIGGDGLARGYIGRTDLTADRFIPHPFASQPGMRLYRTGDRVRYLVDGTLEFLGRRDTQIKLRGYRIELGEIEAALHQRPDVEQAIVIIREDQPGDQRLAAYIVPSSDIHPPTPITLQQALKEQLPHYMIPSAFVLLEELPLTPNGKVNRRALPIPEWQLESGESYVAPRTSTEELLAELWKDLLQLERVGVHDNFFELGGHSLLGVQLIARITDAFQINLPLQMLFDKATISEMAQEMAQLQGGPSATQETRQALPTVMPNPEHRFQPFPLTDVQQAYWIGRNAIFELGNIATHSYLESESRNLDLKRYTQVWNHLIARHEMLRAIVLPNGQQQILAQVPPYELRILDLREQPPEVIKAQLEEVRRQMSHQVLQSDRWPLFELRATLLPGDRTRLHTSSDLLMMDAWSLGILSREMNKLYANSEATLPPLSLSFRDYVLTVNSLQEGEIYQRARGYWMSRLADLPPAPELPLQQNPMALKQPHFTRRGRFLKAGLWKKLKQTASRRGVTPSVILLAAFSTILNMWSKNPRFTINLTLFNRLPLHSQVNDIVGDFTSLTLLAVDHTEPATFTEHARALQNQLWQDLDHRYMSGVTVLRELARIHKSQARASMPVVFTSTLGLQTAIDTTPQNIGERKEMPNAELIYGITQTSQVWLDHQTWEFEGALGYCWDVVEDLFPGGMLDDMFSAYGRLLEQLASDDRWERIKPVVTAQQLARRAEMNDTEAPVSEDLLHMLFAAQASTRPTHPAIVTPQLTLSYQEVAQRAQQVARILEQCSVKPNELVAIIMEKGWEQVVAALGILYAGAAYVPIDPDLPAERLNHLLRYSEVRVALTQQSFDQRYQWPGEIKHVAVDRLGPDGQYTEALPKPIQHSNNLAYVIYTSGSTGLPKGVMIDHQGAVNTILDINKRFAVGPQDRVLALSSLSFDLSVYDVFGTLAAGGTIVIPDARAKHDPIHWANLLQQEQITIWNSVPALMELMVEQITTSRQSVTQKLRLVLLSGDWIPTNLPQRVWNLWKNAQVISLGGATEASIWSILFPITDVEPDWKSIPYGHPMVNQRFHVLNAALESCPDWVPGELFIGGIGLAKGYWKDEQKTNSSFFLHPRTRERLYRTGDLGRYLPNGEIEFLGREDFQVKIRGYRIELGEIESVLSRLTDVAQVVVIVREDTPGDRRLVAYIVATDAKNPPSPANLRQTAQHYLPDYMVPAAFMLLDELPLTPNGKVNRRQLPAPEWSPEEHPAELVEPRTETEKSVFSLWRQVLGLDQFGVYSNFFELGGHSLLGVQLMSRIFDTFHINLTLRALFEEPTIAGLSRAIDQEIEAAARPSTLAPTIEPEVPPAVAARSQIVTETPQPGIMQSIPLISDFAERDRFKARQPGLRKDRPGSWSLHLIDDQDEQSTLHRTFAARRSAHSFGEQQVTLEEFSSLLGVLRQRLLDGNPRYYWSSAGGLYPIQVYLSVKQERVEGIPSGTYYYHPADHRLASLKPGAQIGPEAQTWINQRLHEQSAFSIFLIAQLSAIAPLYGESSRDFCLLEVGAMCQLLETSAPTYNLAMAQAGHLNFAKIQQFFLLEESHLYLHALLAGPAPANREAGISIEVLDEKEWEEGEL